MAISIPMVPYASNKGIGGKKNMGGNCCVGKELLLGMETSLDAVS